MEIPGIAPFSGQPTLTNPLTPENQVVGQKSSVQKSSETSNTELSREQPPTSLGTAQVVNQTNDTDDVGSGSRNPGGNIDLKA